MKCFGHFLLALLFVAMAATASAVEYPVVKSTAQPAKVKVGEHVKFNVSVTAPDLSSIRMIEPFGDRNTTWTLIDRHDRDTKLNATEWQRQIDYTIAPFETGSIPTPEIQVHYKVPNGPERTAKVPTHTITVESVLPQTAEIPEPKAPRGPVELPFPGWVLPLAITLGSLLLAAIIFALWRKFARKVPVLLNPPKRLDEWALGELDAIENEKLIEHKKVKEFHSRVADVVREYVGKLFHVNALDLTTYELLMALEEEPRVSPAREDMRQLLEEADLVKFAKYIPEPNISRRALVRAREVVASTRGLIDTVEETQQPEPQAGPGGPPAAPPAGEPVAEVMHS